MSEVVEYVKTIYALNATTATAATRLLAKRDGYRVRTTKRVECVETVSEDSMPRWKVTLAVVR